MARVKGEIASSRGTRRPRFKVLDRGDHGQAVFGEKVDGIAKFFSGFSRRPEEGTSNEFYLFVVTVQFFGYQSSGSQEGTTGGRTKIIDLTMWARTPSMAIDLVMKDDTILKLAVQHAIKPVAVAMVTEPRIIMGRCAKCATIVFKGDRGQHTGEGLVCQDCGHDCVPSGTWLGPGLGVAGLPPEGE